MLASFVLCAALPFSAAWITDEEMARQKVRPYEARQLEANNLPPVDKTLQNRHILFRKTFELGSVDKASIRVSADDYYRLYVNGEFVGMGPAAGTTDCTYYNEFDVTKLLRKGRNVIAAHTYYQGLVNRVWVSGDNRHGLVLDLVADGRRVLSSDASFKTARHTGYSALDVVGYHTQFMERYDAGAKEVGFERPDFDDSGWAAAVVHPRGGDYTLVPQPTPPVVVEPIRPVSVKRIGADRMQIDFGGIYVGGLTFAAKGPRGGRVKMLFGQELSDDGSVRHKMRCNCNYVEKFVLSGGPRDVLKQYDYKSFRYAELVAPPDIEIDVQSIVLEARHLPFDLKAHPNFTDERLRPVWKLCVDSFRYGAQEQLMDCMDREKGYYLGDGCYTTLAWSVLTGEWAISRKFFDDFLRTKRIDRGLVTCANCAFMQEIAEYPMMMILFAKWYLDATGDVDFIRERIPAFADVLDSYRERYARQDGLLRNLDKWCVVEWPNNYRDGYDADIRQGKICTDVHNAINAWYIGAVICMNEISSRAGLPEYAAVAPLKKAFRNVFYDRERHLFTDREGSRHASMPGNVYATFFRLAPEEDDAAHHAEFLKMVREKGFTAINLFQYLPLFAYLRATGEKAFLHELMVSPDAWLRIIREDGTRTFEGWGKDTKWNTSLFHLTMAAVSLFLCDEGQFLTGFHISTEGSSGGNALLDAVYAPQVVAVPPTYAVRDLCVLADGEIRHYGWQMVGGEKRRVYIASRDHGMNWETRLADANDVGAMVQSPWSGEWLAFGSAPAMAQTLLMRSAKGPGDTHPSVTQMPWRRHECRQLLAMRSRRRWVACFSDARCEKGECYHAAVALSDDDGRNWRYVPVPVAENVPRLHPGDKRPHWFNNGCEPSVAELAGGELLLALRTSGERHRFSRSTDGGETWSAPEERAEFWAANTMPLFFRLSDGRLLFFWNNTAMLPTLPLSEYPELSKGERTGRWECACTNRDALHAAISEDDGRTWRGFREILLNPIRNASDFRENGNDPAQENDKSVHQTQAIELPGGKVLVACGQGVSSRRILVFDPRWLYETERAEDFRSGLGGVSTHLYVRSLSGGNRGWSGHCAWNRIPGALLVREPDTGPATKREALQICRIADPRLVSDRQGVVWNFPAARKGRVKIECRIEGEGFKLTLADHWMNPCDEVGPSRCPFSTAVTGREASPGLWHEIEASWDADKNVASLSCDGKKCLDAPFAVESPAGVSYLHLQTLAERHDPKGAYFRSFRKR